MAGLGVAVLLDGDELGVGRQEQGGVEALVVAPEARRQGKVTGLVVFIAALVLVDVTRAVDGVLVAEELHLVPGVVAVEPDANAGGSVTVAAGVDEAHVADRVVVGDRVDALAVVAVGAVARAAGAGRELQIILRRRDRKAIVAGDERVLLGGEGWGDVVLASVGLGSEVDTREVEVRGGGGVGLGGALGDDRRARGLVLLEPARRKKNDWSELGYT